MDTPHHRAQEAVRDLTVLVTAEEAYPEFERAFLSAQTEIWAGFRVFDLMTRLRSPEARELGDRWFDLILATLNRGVAIRLVVSDFDPVAAPDLHRLAWRTHRQIVAVRELAQDGACLQFSVAMHSARTGLLPRMLFFPVVRRKLAELADRWHDMTGAQRDQFIEETPRLREICHEDANGCLCFPIRLAELYPATHHQKIAVFDRQRVYIGGLDVNERRYDTKHHDRPAERTWHDIQVIATGTVAKAAQAHLETFLDSVAGRSAPSPAAPGFLRTLSRRRVNAPTYISPKPVLREIEERHFDLIRKSRRLIYLETQFLRHKPLARALARQAAEYPELRLIVVLPAAPEDAAFASSRGLHVRFGENQQTRCLARLEAAFGRRRLLIASPVQQRRRESNGRDTLKQAPLVYVHSKVSIFDGASAIVSSANLNGRSMRWDTEAGLNLDRPEHVEELQKKVMGHWLPANPGGEFFDPAVAFGHWRCLVDTNSALPPQQRRGFLVRYDSDAARAIAMPAAGIPEEMV